MKSVSWQRRGRGQSLATLTFLCCLLPSARQRACWPDHSVAVGLHKTIGNDWEEMKYWKYIDDNTAARPTDRQIDEVGNAEKEEKRCLSASSQHANR
ncbi:hypothetical protein DL95DRAFT_388423 [Leptodontidium sp. 2 PMI_412]|nr:hypothetical protein DL95DRAFT_388423 [Leptodontidium sp. 2 PMI_412]